jgi:DNA-binding MarR family transcriptional regulator
MTEALLNQTRNCLCLAARRAARSITRQFDQALRPHGLRSTQFSALAVLALAGPKTVKDLAGILSAERTTMTRNLGVLERNKLVAIRRGDDARERIAELTPKGLRAIQAALTDWQAVQTRIAESMGEDTAESLLAIAWSQDA